MLSILQVFIAHCNNLVNSLTHLLDCCAHLLHLFDICVVGCPGRRLFRPGGGHGHWAAGFDSIRGVGWLLVQVMARG